METIQKLFRLYQTNKNIREAVRFCIVGALCSVIDASIYYLVLLFAPYSIALVCGYCLSLIVNYFLTVYWTFQKTANAKNAIGIVGAHLFNLFVVRMGLMYLFIDVIGLNEQFAFLPTLVISVITNFIIVRLVVNRL